MMGKYKEVRRGRRGGPTQLPRVATPPAALAPAAPATSVPAPPLVSAGPVPLVQPEPVMSWPLAVVVIVAVVCGFGFAFALIAVVGMAPWMATVITMAIVSAIVSALVPRRGEGGVGRGRRIANAIHALGGGDGSGGPGGAR